MVALSHFQGSRPHWPGCSALGHIALAACSASPDPASKIRARHWYIAVYLLFPFKSEIYWFFSNYRIHVQCREKDFLKTIQKQKTKLSAKITPINFLVPTCNKHVYRYGYRYHRLQSSQTIPNTATEVGENLSHHLPITQLLTNRLKLNRITLHAWCCHFKLLHIQL